jgi:energy-coupling factor transport system ATP-binding protein
MEHLRALHRAGHTIVLITHDMKLVAEWSERMIVLQEGQVLADGTPRAVFARSGLLEQAALAPPPITELSQRLRPLGMRGDSPTVEAFYREYSALSAPDGMEFP